MMRSANGTCVTVKVEFGPNSPLVWVNPTPEEVQIDLDQSSQGVPSSILREDSNNSNLSKIRAILAKIWTKIRQGSMATHLAYEHNLHTNMHFPGGDS